MTVAKTVFAKSPEAVCSFDAETGSRLTVVPCTSKRGTEGSFTLFAYTASDQAAPFLVRSS